MRRKSGAGGSGGGGIGYPKAMDVALRLLGFRSRTEREMEKRLLEKGVGAEVAGRVCARLREIGYLDDRKFALDWIKSRAGGKCRSPSMLKRELQGKGISRSIAEEAVAEGLAGRDLFEEACALARRKMRQGGEGETSRLRPKVQGLLLRRGFDYDFIRKVIDATAPSPDDGYPPERGPE